MKKVSKKATLHYEFKNFGNYGMLIYIYTMFSIININPGDNLCLPQCMDMLIWLAKGRLALPKLEEKTQIRWLGGPGRGFNV